jgi:hypothetical protein
MTPPPDSKVPARYLSARSAYIGALLALPVFLVFVYLGKWEMGIGPWICAALVLAVVRIHWDLRRSRWFWASIAVSTVLQAPFILLVPWSDRHLTGITLLPVGLADYGIVYGCVKLAERMIKRNAGASSAG